MTTPEQIAPVMNRSAKISSCGLYRYRLDRWWADGARAVFIMLNPSTADAEIDDPTIRRCIGFARAWRAPGLTVVNLFAFRATDPEALRGAAAPIGPENDETIAAVAYEAADKRVVAAWGTHSFIGGRGYQARKIVKASGSMLCCLGRTKEGNPRHPLYVPAAQQLVQY